MKLLTAHEAAEQLGIHIQTLRGHVADGDIVYVNISRGKDRKMYRFTHAAIDAFSVEERIETCPLVFTRPRLSHQARRANEIGDSASYAFSRHPKARAPAVAPTR